MYIFFILAMVVAAFGGPLTGTGQEGVRAAKMMEASRTRIMADAVLDHHRAALTYAENHTATATEVDVPLLTAGGASGNVKPWEIYGSQASSSIVEHGDVVQANFGSYADPTANALITYSLETGPFRGSYSSSYDRAGVLKQIARKAGPGTFVGVVQELSSVPNFRNQGSVKTFDGLSISFSGDSAYANKVALSPLGREARALPFTRAEFDVGTIVVMTQYGTGDKTIRNPFGS